MVRYIDYPNRGEWLKGRVNSLGASEIGIVLGYSGFSTPKKLWQEKTGHIKPADLSNNPNVQYGTEAEEHMRALFALKHKSEYEVEYHPYRVYFQEETPYLTSTLDGEITRLSDGAKGICEFKTAAINSGAALKAWEGQIPMMYFCQACQQLATTGKAFVVLNAELRFPDYHAEIREYTVTAAQHAEDIEYVTSEGKKFWKYVVEQKQPPTILKI